MHVFFPPKNVYDNGLREFPVGVVSTKSNLGHFDHAGFWITARPFFFVSA
jgi:hypothetical protein